MTSLPVRLLVGVVVLFGVLAHADDAPKTVACTGTIRDAKGKPIAGATVTVAGAASVLTEADGTYRVEGVSPGEALAVAEMKGRFRVKALLAVGAKSVVVWDAAVACDPRVIRGRLVDEYGQGLTNRYVTLLPRRHWISNGAFNWTNARGEFELYGNPRLLHRICVAGDTAGWAHSFVGSASWELLTPGVTDVVVRLPRERTPMARVRSRILDAEGAPVSAAMVIVDDDGERWWGAGSFVRESAGSQVSRRVAPGAYAVWAKDVRGGFFEFDRFDVIGAANLDLGVLRFPPSGTARIVRLPASAAGHVYLTPIPRSARSWAWANPRTYELEGEISVSSLPPGTYRVHCTDPTLQAVERTFDVRSGQETTVEVPLRTAPVRRLKFRFPAPVPYGSKLLVIVREASGDAAWRQIIDRDESPVLRLGAGAYRVEIETDESLTFAGSVAVPDTDDGKPIGVVLR